MSDFSQIQDEKLRKLVENSPYFKQLSAAEQEKYISQMQGVSETKVAELCEFFEAQNLKAQTNLYNELKKLHDDIVALEQKVKKLIAADPEKKSKQEDKGRLNNILTELNQN